MAKRGRPTGATSWQRNPNPVAAHHAKVLMEVWLAGAPVLEIRAMLSSLAGNPEAQALIEECWSKRGNDRRYTVPPQIKRKLCRLAVAHVVELRRDAIQRRRARAAETALRTQGWTEIQIAEILNRRAAERIDLEAPDLEKVLAAKSSTLANSRGLPDVPRPPTITTSPRSSSPVRARLIDLSKVGSNVSPSSPPWRTRRHQRISANRVGCLWFQRIVSASFISR